MAGVTRKEQLANGVALTPLTREEQMMTGAVLTPLTQKERVLYKLVTPESEDQSVADGPGSVINQ